MTKQITVWVLSTCVPGSPDPVLPFVFSSEAAAIAKYDETMRAEWATQRPEDEETCEPLLYPGDPAEANRILGADNPDWGRWQLTSHQVDVDVGGVTYQLLRDLIRLAEQAPAYKAGYAWTAVAMAAARNEFDQLLLAELAKPVEPPHRPVSDNAP
jgi:hypothetical protein